MFLSLIKKKFHSLSRLLFGVTHVFVLDKTPDVDMCAPNAIICLMWRVYTWRGSNLSFILVSRLFALLFLYSRRWSPMVTIQMKFKSISRSYLFSWKALLFWGSYENSSIYETNTTPHCLANHLRIYCFPSHWTPFNDFIINCVIPVDLEKQSLVNSSQEVCAWEFHYCLQGINSWAILLILFYRFCMFVEEGWRVKPSVVVLEVLADQNWLFVWVYL